MALVKALKSKSGKPSEVSSGSDVVKQYNMARTYSPVTGGISVPAPDHQWFLNETGAITQAADTTTGTAVTLNATHGSAPTAMTASIGSASIAGFAFDGGRDIYKASPGRSNLFDGTNKFSVSTWVRFNGGESKFLNVSSPGATGRYVQIGIKTNQSQLSVFTYTNGSGEEVQSVNPGGTFAGTWRMVTVTMSDTMDLKMYVNASQVVSLNVGGALMSGEPDNFTLGSRNGSDQYFDGDIASCYWWKGATLTSDDITTLYQAGSPAIEELQAGDPSAPVNKSIVYMKLSGGAGKVAKAQADSASTADVLGMYVSADEAVIAARGAEMSAPLVQSAITMAAGDIAYLSASEAGKITNVAPSTQGHAVVRLGKMESATMLIFDPQFLYTN